MDGRQAQAVGGDLMELFPVLADAAAGAAHGEGGTDNDGIADHIGEVQRIVQVFHHLGGNDRLVQLFHGILEELPVLGAVDGLRLAGQQTHAAAVQETVAGQLHREVQTHLAAQVGQDGIGLFLLDDALDHFRRQRLDVDMIGNIGVGHDGGRVGVDEDRLHALRLEGAAGLGAGIVKLCRLTNDDRAGSDDQHLFDPRVFRHCRLLLSLPACG